MPSPTIMVRNPKKTERNLVEPLQQVVEQAVADLAFRRASSERSAKRRCNSGLVGQVFDADYTPVHLVPGRRLLVSIASH